MAKQTTTDKDWAIVLGIQNYPGLAGGSAASLGGPVNDALAFQEWLLDPCGAGVPEKQVLPVIQADLAPHIHATAAEVFAAKPGLRECEAPFDVLELESSLSKEAGQGPKFGRRLYIYAAGHGIEPALRYPGDVAGPALLTANATYGEYRHIWTKQYADRCRLECWFDEVLLFMDCCRDLNRSVPGVPRGDLNNLNFTKLGRYFHALGTKWNGQTREKEIDGARRGIFSVALLRALRGEAADPVTKAVTVGRLKTIVPQLMLEIAPEQFRSLHADLPEFFPDANDELVVCDAPPVEHRVTIRLGSEVARDEPLDVELGEGEQDRPRYYDGIPNADSIDVMLPRALFVCHHTRSSGQKKGTPFQVKGNMRPLDL